MALLAHTPLVLIILDGFGHRVEQANNAIALARKPHWDRWWQQYPHTFIEGSGQAVGLPVGQMGNSEVGHLNMGSGRIVQQDYTRIAAAIDTGAFAENTMLVSALQTAAQQHCGLHVFGLLSPGGVHSHESQIFALLALAAKYKLTKVYLHAFLDGRDTPPKSAKASLQRAEKFFAEHACGRVASICGRYYAMDRDQRWDRTAAAYRLLTEGVAEQKAPTATAALELAYAAGETDEFVKPCVVGETATTVEDGDIVIYMNYRADRARQLTRAFTESQFSGFQRKQTPQLNRFLTLTQYADNITADAIFPPQYHANVLGDYLAAQGLQQCRIAETEKYAHVTFFFNGGVESPFPGEERVLIPSPQVATYDLQPEMKAPEVAQAIINAMTQRKYAVIISNFANADMVGHTGNLQASIQAIEAIDNCLGKIVACAQQQGAEVIITADHGNAELMLDTDTGQAHTAHTSLPVPFLYIGRSATICKENGALRDIAPTMLYLLGMSKPKEMTGTSLLQLN